MARYIISQILLRIDQRFEVCALIISGAINCTPTSERETLKTIGRGAIHRARSRLPFVTVLRNDELSQIPGYPSISASPNSADGE